MDPSVALEELSERWKLPVRTNTSTKRFISSYFIHVYAFSSAKGSTRRPQGRDPEGNRPSSSGNLIFFVFPYLLKFSVK